jgi:hypothetical protein
MKKMKPLKPLQPRNTAKTQYGSGEFMGSGLKNKIGRPIVIMGETMESNPKKIKTPPKSMV